MGKISVTIFLLFNFTLQGALATSEPYNPEKAKREKEEYCAKLVGDKGKLPSKFHGPYQKAISTHCPDTGKSLYDIYQFLEQSFTQDENSEIQLILYGKDSYCNFVLGLTKLYKRNGGTEDANSATAPEYQQLKSACADASKGTAEVLPLKQKLSKIYYHF